MCAVCKETRQESEWLSRVEAAQYLGVHTESIRRAVKRGDLIKYTRNGRPFYRREDLVEYHRPKPAPKPA